MLELKKSPGKTAENFFSKVQKSLGESVQVRGKKAEDCEITIKENAREALEKQVGLLGFQDSAIRRLRNYQLTSWINLQIAGG